MIRAQLIELTADRFCSSRKAVSLNIALTMSWQSSNEPSSAMLWTLLDSTVVICRRCTSDVRPFGCRMKMSIASRSRQASIAAEPVSPEVAPTMVTRSFRFARTVSNRRPSSCSATSLNASVGPWNSSITQVLWSSWTRGRHGGMVEAGIGVADQRRELRLA